MDVRVGLYRKLSTEELMLLNCGVGEDSWDPLGLQGRRFKQFILKEINPEYSLEGLMLKLKLQYFGHLTWRTDSSEKTLMLRKIEGRRRREWQRMRWLDGITDRWTWVWVNSGSWWWTGRPGMLRFMGSQRIRPDWVTELNWTGNCWWTGKPGGLQSMGSQRVRHNWVTEVNWTEAKVPHILYHLST